MSAVLALPLRYKTTTISGELFEFAWAMSEYLGGLALLPQLIHSWTRRFLRRDGEGPIRVHRTIFVYLYVLLGHQLLYLINWTVKCV